MLKHAATAPIHDSDGDSQDNSHHRTAYERLEIRNQKFEAMDIYDRLYNEKALVEAGKTLYSFSLKAGFNFSVHDLTISFLEDFREKKFIDSNFPPEICSLLDFKDERLSWRHLIWLRPSSLLSAPNHIFRRIPLVQEISMGILKNFYFISAVGCLLDCTNSIFQVFLREILPTSTSSSTFYTSIRQKEIESARYSCYQVFLYEKGVRKEIVLDDYFPALERWKPAFGACINSDLWLLLLEKGWAKVHNSYGNIQFGHFDEVIQGITGCPVINLWTKSQSLISIMQNALQSHNLVFASVNNSAEDDEKRLKTGYTYPILSIDCYSFGDKIVEAITVKNIWGSFTPFRKTILKPIENSKETLTFSKSDFIRLFEIVHISCVIEKPMNNHSRTSIGNGDTKYFAVSILNAKSFIGIHQESKRKYSRVFQENWKYGKAIAVLARQVHPGHYKYIDSCCTSKPSTWLGLHGNLEIGEYVLCLKFKFKVVESDSIVINVISNGEASVTETPEIVFKGFLESVARSMVIREGDSKSEMKEIKEDDKTVAKIFMGRLVSKLYFLVFESHKGEVCEVEGKVGKARHEIKFTNTNHLKGFKCRIKWNEPQTIIFSSDDVFDFDNLPINFKFTWN